MWELLYIRRCEVNDGQIGKLSPSSVERIAFKESLEILYQEILRFQVGSYCYYDTNAALRLGQDIIKWNGWDNTLEKIREQEDRFASVNAIWMDITYAEERSAAHKRHLEAMRCWQTVGTDTSSLLEVVRDAQAEKKREGLLDWLCTVDPSEAYNAARDKHMRGTSGWLVEDSKEFQGWKQSAGSVLWLNGKRASVCPCLHRAVPTTNLLQLVLGNQFLARPSSSIFGSNMHRTHELRLHISSSASPTNRNKRWTECSRRF